MNKPRLIKELQRMGGRYRTGPGDHDFTHRIRLKEAKGFVEECMAEGAEEERARHGARVIAFNDFGPRELTERLAAIEALMREHEARLNLQNADIRRLVGWHDRSIRAAAEEEPF